MVVAKLHPAAVRARLELRNQTSNLLTAPPFRTLTSSLSVMPTVGQNRVGLPRWVGLIYNQKTFREVYTGATWRPLRSPRLDPYHGSKPKGDFLSVLATGEKKAGERVGATSTPIPAGTAQDGTRSTGPSPGGMARVAVRTRWEAVERLIVIPG